MTSYERVVMALNHREADRIPYDLGGTLITGIHVKAYKHLLEFLGIRKDNFFIQRERLGIVQIDEDILQKLNVDTRVLFPNELAKTYSEDEDYSYYLDEWGVKWRKPKKDGLYFDLIESPMKGDLTTDMVDGYVWPDFLNPELLDGIKDRALSMQDKCLVLEGILGGEIFDGSFFLRGFENFYMDLALNPKGACYLMDKMLELQLEYWAFALDALSDQVLVVRVGDDLGEQATTRISPEMYRKYVKPRHRKLFLSLKKMARGDLYIVLHSDGAIYNLIPDLIEIGVDAINPVQYNCQNMDTKILKREFGRDLSFWGGGLDTQHILPKASPKQVKDEVKRRIDDLAPGGGFIFSQVHNIQHDVPPENIMAMWEAVQEYGKY